MKVAIRTDASPEIGTGHLMRCLTLADALKSGGAEVTFLSAPSTSPWRELVEQRGLRMVVLNVAGEGMGDDDLVHSSWLPWGQVADAGATLRALSHVVDWLVVDHFALDARWESTVRKSAAKIAVIDDLADRRHDSDLLLDHNAQRPARYDDLVPVLADRLIGPRYALLRRDFADAREQRRTRDGSIRRIAIFMGGTDPNGTTLLALDALSHAELRHIPIDVVIGSASPHLAAIAASAERRGETTIHVDTKHVAGIFARADLAIGSGGVAALERCCVGLPAVTVAIADNQRPGLDALQQCGAVAHLGDAASVVPTSLGHAIRRLCASPEDVRAIGEVARSLVDGRGTARVVAAMLGHPEGVAVRRATMGDAEGLHRWRNADAVRAASFSSEPIAYDDHCRWLERALKDGNRIILIGTLAQTPVGTVRYDLSGDCATVSVVVAPEVQARGIGAALLEAGETYVRISSPATVRLNAEIKRGNETSVRLFEKAGFSPIPSDEPTRMLYVKQIASPLAKMSLADV